VVEVRSQWLEESAGPRLEQIREEVCDCQLRILAS